MRATRLASSIAALAWLSACGGAPAAARAPGVARLPTDGVFEVAQAGGVVYVIQGPAASGPEHAPDVGRHRAGALQVVDQETLEPPLTFTVVGVRGSCASSASRTVKLADASGWLDAIALDGCRGDPTEVRLALVGEVADARWLAPDESLEADGQPLPTSEFFEGDVSGKSLHRQKSFMGLSLRFEQRWVEPRTGPVATRVLEGETVLSAFFADVPRRGSLRSTLAVRRRAERPAQCGSSWSATRSCHAWVPPRPPPRPRTPRRERPRPRTRRHRSSTSPRSPAAEARRATLSCPTLAQSSPRCRATERRPRSRCRPKPTRRSRSSCSCARHCRYRSSKASASPFQRDVERRAKSARGCSALPRTAGCCSRWERQRVRHTG